MPVIVFGDKPSLVNGVTTEHEQANHRAKWRKTKNVTKQMNFQDTFVTSLCLCRAEQTGGVF